MRYYPTSNILEFLEAKFTSRKITSLGLPARDRGNHYLVIDFLTRMVNDKTVEFPEQFAAQIFEEAAHEGYTDLVKYTHTNYPRDIKEIKEVFISTVGNYSSERTRDVQDYLLSLMDEKTVTEVVYDAHPEDMWANNSKAKIRAYLLGKGVAILGGKRNGKDWQRSYTISHIISEEIVPYREKFPNAEFSEYDVEYICSFRKKGGDSRFTEFAKWPGFIDALRKYPKWLTHTPESWKNKNMVIHYLPRDTQANLYEAFFNELKRQSAEKLAKDEEHQESLRKAHQKNLQAFADLGVPMVDVKGYKKDKFSDRTEFAYWHDGVQYMVQLLGSEQQFAGKCDVGLEVLKLKELIRRHHDVVKKVYDHMVASTGGDIWVMSGGGSQLQAFFGSETGYLAILYLDLLTEERDVETSGTITGNSKLGDDLIKDIDIQGVKVMFARDIWPQYFKEVQE